MATAGWAREAAAEPEGPRNSAHKRRGGARHTCRRRDRQKDRPTGPSPTMPTVEPNLGSARRSASSPTCPTATSRPLGCGAVPASSVLHPGAFCQGCGPL
jgi:hypothetical protein